MVSSSFFVIGLFICLLFMSSFAHAKVGWVVTMRKTTELNETTEGGNSMCEPLEKIPRVQTTCVTGFSRVGMECLLECLYWGPEFEKPAWKYLVCKTVDNKTSWHTLATNERITLAMIRDEGFCSIPPN